MVGGNFFRGVAEQAKEMDRVSADHMGMLATVINASLCKMAAVTAMRGKVGAWALFLVCLLLLNFVAATSYSKTADLAFISLRLALVALLSILLVRERWRNWDYRQQTSTAPGV